MHRGSAVVLAALAVAVSGPGSSGAGDASPPQGVTLAIYDAGFALASELRRVALVRGENEIRFGALPPAADPASFHVMTVQDARGLEHIEHRFAYDLAGLPAMVSRFAGEPVAVRVSGETVSGRLAGTPPGGAWLAVLQGEGGGVVALPADRVDSIAFRGGLDRAFTEPTLLWRCDSGAEGPQNVRLSYVVRDLQWSGGYEVVVEPDGRSARIEARVLIRNGSGGRYEGARVRLNMTELGGAAAGLTAGAGEARPAMRYRYGSREPESELTAASIAPLMTFDLPRPVSIGPGETLNAEYVTAPSVPVSRFYVYDGVRFDRFQRNSRSDWSYGTEDHAAVVAHLQFTNAPGPDGTGRDLPPGAFRLYQRGAEGRIDYVGEDQLHAVPLGQGGHIVVGPAKGLSGSRARTGFAEVKPLHEYEESFEISLANDTAEDVEVRVVEHLYRWREYEIVKSDTEYDTAAPQTLEFRPALKAGGKRSIHYTVRYRW